MKRIILLVAAATLAACGHAPLRSCSRAEFDRADQRGREDCLMREMKLTRLDIFLNTP